MIEKILKILPLVNTEYPRLNNGGCGVFAKIISEITEYNEFGFLWDNDDQPGDPPAHVYVKINNKFLDSNGLHTEKEILDRYKNSNEDGYFLGIYDYNELEYWYEKLGEGLFTADHNPLYKEIKKFILDSIRNVKTFEHFVGFRNIAFSGIILDKESRYKLLNKFGDVIPDEWDIHTHHMTICMGELPTIYRDYRGEEVELTVTHLGISDDAIAIKVDGFFKINRKDSREPDDEKSPHITIAINPPNSPKISNQITDWEEIEPFKITGIVKEIEGI